MPSVTKTKMDIAVEALFQCLPASNYEEIRRRMARELGHRINTGFVRNTLSYLRGHVEKYGYTVCYVKNGTSGPALDKDRYFAMLVEKDRSFHVDPQHRRHFTDGTLSKLLGVATVTGNLAMMIEVYLQYEPSKSQRDFWEDQLETLRYLNKRAARISKAVKIVA